MRHTWPCPTSVGHTTCTCSPLERSAEEFRASCLALGRVLADTLRLEDLVAALAAFLAQPGRHRGPRRPVALEAILAAVAAVELVGLLVLVGVLA